VAVRIGLSDGSAFVVDSSFQDLRAKVSTALAEAGEGLIDVRNGDGKLRGINPRQIAYVEETDEDELTAAEEGVRQAARAPQAQGA
jgi:hypothetical protein